MGLLCLGIDNLRANEPQRDASSLTALHSAVISVFQLSSIVCAPIPIKSTRRAGDKHYKLRLPAVAATALFMASLKLSDLNWNEVITSDPLTTLLSDRQTDI